MKKTFALFLALILVYSTTCYAKESGRVYNCDYKVLSFNTNIEITKDAENVGNISGKIVRLVTDPLDFTDSYGEIIGQASDTYGFITQDTHGIMVKNTLECIMEGKFAFFGEKYDILNNKQEVIGSAKFNAFNTKGEIVDNDGKVIATYSSPFLMYDYDITIYSDILSDEAVLLIMASYVSDIVADSESSDD